MRYSLAELCICAAAETFRGDGERMITSIGLVPRLAASLAKHTCPKRWSHAQTW